MKKKFTCCLLLVTCYLLLFSISSNCFAQKNTALYGRVIDENGKPKVSVNIALSGKSGGTVTDSLGNFRMEIPAGENITIVLSHIGMETQSITVKLSEGEQRKIEPVIKTKSKMLQDITVEDDINRTTTLTPIDPKIAGLIPSPSGGVEAVIMTLPGVAARSELSTQYSVRGGNFDENLIYVNDVEIYRPFLVRSGEQEGISFINSDMVSSIQFSAGGFEAKYGDKMSSVLDIRYRKPETIAGSLSLSMLGGSAHVEGVAINNRFTWQVGVRQKSNQYLLSQLNTQGDYKPSFTDFQGYFTYNLSKKFELALLGNYSRSRYTFIPESRETSFGTVNEALRLKVYFDGQEVDRFETIQGALISSYQPSQRLRLKFIAGVFRTAESEHFDIMGQYWLDELEKDFGKEKFGQAIFNRGVGTYLDHARNDLEATVFVLEQKGYLMIKPKFLQWGIRYTHEEIRDVLSEWKMIDSSGFSLPHAADSVGYTSPETQPPTTLELFESLKTRLSVGSNRLSGFLQNNWNWISRDTAEYTLNAGVRASFWDINGQTNAGPRITFSIKPNWKRDIVFKTAAGMYYQPPFYRELRDPFGKLNTSVKAQESIHFVIGFDYNLLIWNRPFKIVAEGYYKHLDNLIPYEIDNLRIRYYAKNNAYGYAAGIDARINGEFVKGIESWASFSLMQTQENLTDDFYYDYYNAAGEKIIRGYTYDQNAVDSIRTEPGFIPRPTDQIFKFSLFFQDYLPRFPQFKMHLNLMFATGLPFGPPTFERYKDVSRIPPYRRVDIGFSYMLMDENKQAQRKGVLSFLKSIWLSAEVFNLLGTNNTISYLWIKDISNRQYAVPNFLTSRLLNGRIIVKF